MAVERVQQIEIQEEVQQAYLSYAMSVIVARALPDVRDGLKPVQRRILYVMHEMGLHPNAPYKKSARIVGEVLGKFHPHGDMAVYEALARMAQEFTMRYPLVDGQGNFGSIDGDPPAAMRYTEARLTPMAEELLEDLEKETVDWVDNFDGSLKEPVVLPAKAPQLLINGAAGIAVGMATSIPPHNLSEVCDALCYMIDHWGHLDRITVDDLMAFIKGPDFPTGGVVFRYADDGETDAVRAAYAVGKGQFVVQARAHIEEAERGKVRIVVTELPYQVNKAALIERIAELVREGRIEGITDLRDESDRRGMRLVIEVARTADPREVLTALYKHTPLQTTFGVQMLALVDGEPRLLPLKKVLQLFVEHRQQVIRRRSEYELARARERAHILEGLLTALAHLDEVIALIRRSKDAEEAKAGLMRRYRLTEAQALAILEMPLRRLARLEREKIEAEYKEKQGRIRELEDLLAHPKKILKVIREELQELKAKYGDARRTFMADRARGALTVEDLMPDQPVWVTITAGGRILRMPLRGGPAWPHGDRPMALVRGSTRGAVVLFTDRGTAAGVAVHRIPEGEEGIPILDLVALPEGETVVAALPMPRRIDANGAGPYVFLVTRNAMCKRIAWADLNRPGAFSAMGISEEDALVSAFTTYGEGEILMATAAGQAIRFAEEEVRMMGLSAAGVLGIKLGERDQVIGAALVKPHGAIVIGTAHGFMKRTAAREYPRQGRYGVGVQTATVSEKTGPVVGVAAVEEDETLWVVGSRGTVKAVKVKDLPRVGRARPGTAVVSLKSNETMIRLIAPAALERGGGRNDRGEGRRKRQR